MRLCPICHSDRRETIYQTPTGQTIHNCSDCRMVFSDNTSIVDYAANSMYICAATYPPKTEHYETIVQNCIQAGVTRDASVLDVGCALGNQIQKFKDCGFREVHGLSVSPEEVNECVQRGLIAFVSSVAEEPRQQYDLVILSHVLEHIPQPVPFLRDLRRWLKPDGTLYVETPDALHYVDTFSSICQGFNNEHINHFDTPHLAEALIRAGFSLRDFHGNYIANDGHPYPCVWWTARPRQCGIILRAAVAAYADLLSAQMLQVNRSLSDQLARHVGPLAIWGAGQTAHLLLEGVVGKFPLIAATDTNPAYHGKVIHGCNILPPNHFRPRSDVPILVCSQLSRQVIVDTIRAMGLKNRLITLESA